MPEVAHRVDVEVSECSFRGRTALWSPTGLAPPNRLFINGDYIEDKVCLIPDRGGCRVDMRVDLAESTRGSIELLREAFEDPWIADSGAAVPITIASHNGGYDDSRFLGGRVKYYNLLPAYRRHLEAKGFEYDPEFVGKAIACETNEYDNADNCGSPLHRHTQHYTYKVIAQHFLAVCYYGSNYSDDPRFKEWKPYTRGDGYCTRIKVPTREQVEEKL